MPDRAAIVAERLRLARQRAGLTMLAVAQRLGRNRNTLESWESGKTSPSTLMLLELVELYRCSADWILGRDTATGFFALIDTEAERHARTAPNLATWRARLASMCCLVRGTTECVTDLAELSRRIETALAAGASLGIESRLEPPPTRTRD